MTRPEEAKPFPLEYSVPARPQAKARPRWTGAFSVCALLATSVAVLISTGGHSSIFLPGERFVVVCVLAVSALFTFAASARVRAGVRAEGVGAAVVACGVILAFAVLLAALAHISLPDRSLLIVPATPQLPR